MKVTVQVPVPLVIVIVLPPAEHAPEAATTTGCPDAPPVAATVNVASDCAVGGACCVTVIVWSALLTVWETLPLLALRLPATPL